MNLHRRLLKNRKRKGDRAGFCENEVHKSPPLCRGSFHEPWGIPRSTPNIKGPLVQRGLSRQRLRDCLTIILENLQIGSLWNNPPEFCCAKPTPLCTRGAFLLVRQLVHYTCGDSSLLYGGFYW